MAFVWILLGLVLLVLGGDWLVKGATGIALKLKIAPLIVGLTIVSFATSAPELIVSVRAAFTGHPDIALGNVIGSNIANIGLILGLTAMAYVLPVTWLAYRFDWWVMLVASGLLGLFALDHVLSAFEGILLVSGLIAYVGYKIRDHRKSKVEVEVDIDTSEEKKALWYLILVLVLSVLALRYGAVFLVKGAVIAALDAGIEERVVSLTVVAFGTSVPELAASIMAARKGEKEMAIGNVIGSNIFNILSVLGFSAIITDVPVQNEATLHFDFWWMLAFAFSLWPLMSFFKKRALGRVEGGIMLLGYVTYVYFLIR